MPYTQNAFSFTLFFLPTSCRMREGHTLWGSWQGAAAITKLVQKLKECKTGEGISWDVKNMYMKCLDGFEPDSSSSYSYDAPSYNAPTYESSSYEAPSYNAPSYSG